MNNRALPRLVKWPFALGDLLLLATAAWLVLRPAPAPGLGQALLAVVAVALGAWLGVMPFLMEYRAALRLAEADQLATVVSQMGRLEAVGEQVRLATGQWQTVQEHCERAVAAARDIGERMTEEVQRFTEFMRQANDTEKAHLRLEADRARRAESEWLQVLVRLLDHVYALYMAGVRSGQPRLREQLGHFQAACRDIVRRVGLIPVEAAPDEPFDELKHQLAEEGAPAPAGTPIAETVATGYTFQGRVLRPPIVRVKTPPPAPPATEEPSAAAPEPEAAHEAPPAAAPAPEPQARPDTVPAPPPSPAAEPPAPSDPQLELGGAS